MDRHAQPHVAWRPRAATFGHLRGGCRRYGRRHHSKSDATRDRQWQYNPAAAARPRRPCTGAFALSLTQLSARRACGPLIGPFIYDSTWTPYGHHCLDPGHALLSPGGLDPGHALLSLSCDHSCDDGSTWHGGRCACARTAVRPSFLGVRTSRLCSMDFKPRMHHPRTELKSVAASSAPVPVCATL